MIWDSTLLKLMRFILQASALALGSASILALWGSFYVPQCGEFAAIMLFTASFITLGLPQPPARRTSPTAAVLADLRAGAPRLRHYWETLQLRLRQIFPGAR